MGLSWVYVWIIAGVLAGLLLGVFVALLLLRHSVRSVADLQREATAERVVERREAEAERAAAGRDDAAGGAALRLTLREYLDRRDGHMRAHFYAALKAVPGLTDERRGRLAREAVATAAGDWERDLAPSILTWLDTAHVDVPEAGRDGGAREGG